MGEAGGHLASDAGLQDETWAAPQQSVVETTHDGQPPINDPIGTRLRRFRALHGRLLRWVTRTMPWVMLGVVASLLVTRATDPMFISALLAAAVAGLLF